MKLYVKIEYLLLLHNVFHYLKGMFSIFLMQGHKIYATCRQNQLISLGSKCVIGEWKIIENMSVTAAKNSLRPTDHMYKISFIGQIKITNCEFVNEDMFLSLVEFKTIMSGNLNSSILIGKKFYIYHLFLIFYII